MTQAYRHAKDQMYAFSNPNFISVYVGTLGEMAFYNWAEKEKLCPKWGDISQGYCTFDVSIGANGFDVKSMKTLSLETNWFKFTKEQLERIRTHSVALVYTAVNIQKAPDDIERIRKIYSDGIVVDIMGWSSVGNNKDLTNIMGIKYL